LALAAKAAPDTAYAAPAGAGGRHGRALSEQGWRRLFTAAFKRSRNAMVLADERRTIVDVNRAFCNTVQRRRADLVGKPLYSVVRQGTEVSDARWKELLDHDESVGDAVVDLPDGNTLRAHWAAHPETVTDRRLVLIVTVSTYRAGRHFRREIDDDHEPGELSERELEIVRLVAMGLSGPEIAEQLHISHNTVRTHIHNAMIKTGARSRAHLVAKALGAGIALSGD
jgi:PAS domain S-box-containing protein